MKILKMFEGLTNGAAFAKAEKGLAEAGSAAAEAGTGLTHLKSGVAKVDLDLGKEKEILRNAANTPIVKKGDPLKQLSGIPEGSIYPTSTDPNASLLNATLAPMMIKYEPFAKNPKIEALELSPPQVATTTITKRIFPKN